MQTTPLRVALLEPRHIPQAARVLAEAMQVDAAYQYLFPDPEERLRGLARLFRGNLGVHLAHRCTYVGLNASSRVTATVTLRPPGGIAISRLRMLRHGMLGFVLAHGRAALRRLLWLKATYDALEVELAGRKPHGYVHMMAVATAQQGRGVGSELLGRVLPAYLERHPGIHTVLTTHIAQNQAFYQRAGFSTTWERVVRPPDDAAPYTVWGMTRGPQMSTRAPHAPARAPRA